jgi:hypothetical protein
VDGKEKQFLMIIGKIKNFGQFIARIYAKPFSKGGKV